MSCLQSTMPMAQYGLKTVWADIDPKYGVLDPDSVKSKITAKTKVIINYHFCGYPGYVEEIHQFKTNTKQDRYKGLTYDYMRWYISIVESKEDALAVLAGLEYLINISKGHSMCKRYSTVKSWFLKRYPDVEIFGKNEDKTTLEELVAHLIEKRKQQNHNSDSDSAKNSSFPAADEQSDNVTVLPPTGTES